MPLGQFGFDGLKECLDSGVIMAIFFAAHRHFEVMLAQDLLVIMRTVLGGFNRSSQHIRLYSV
jgi:hypothetical protein